MARVPLEGTAKHARCAVVSTGTITVLATCVHCTMHACTGEYRGAAVATGHTGSDAGAGEFCFVAASAGETHLRKSRASAGSTLWNLASSVMGWLMSGNLRPAKRLFFRKRMSCWRHRGPVRSRTKEHIINQPARC